MLVQGVYSKILSVIVLCVLITTGALAQKSPRKQGAKRPTSFRSALSPKFHKAGADAYEALQRVPLLMTKVSEADLQRFDAEMALTMAWRSQVNAADKEASQILDASWRMGELARNAFAHNDYANLQTYMHAHDVCLVEATLIFDPAAFDDEGEAARGAGKHCTSLKQQIEAGIEAGLASAIPR